MNQMMEIVSNAKSIMLVAVGPSDDDDGEVFHYYCSDPLAEAGFIEYAAMVHEQRMNSIIGNKGGPSEP